MPERLYFLLAYRLLTISLHLNFGLSSPIQNVQVVPLANNGEATISVVLTTGTSRNKTQTTFDTGRDGNTFNLIEEGSKSDSAGSSITLTSPGKETTSGLGGKTSENATQAQISKLIERPSNGKSFFTDLSVTKPPTKPDEKLENKEKTNPAGLGGGAEPKEKFATVKLLSEKPLVSSPTGDDTKKAPDGPTPDSLASKLSSPGEKAKEGAAPKALPEPKDSTQPKQLTEKGNDNPKAIADQKAPTEPKKVELAEAKRAGGEENTRPERPESKKKSDPSSVGKDIKPLFEKPTTTADETNGAPVLLSLGQKTEDPHSHSGHAEETGAHGKQASKEATNDKPQKALPTIDSTKDLDPEHNLKAPPPATLQATSPSAPPEKKEKESQPPVSKENSPPDALYMRMAGTQANTLSVVQGGSNSTDTDAQKSKEGEEKSSSKIVYIGAGVIGFIVLVVVVIIFARKQQQKENQLPEGGKSWGVQSEVPIEFGSGGGVNEITTPLSPPMSLAGKSSRGIPVTLPTRRGDEDLVGATINTRPILLIEARPTTKVNSMITPDTEETHATEVRNDLIPIDDRLMMKRDNPADSQSGNKKQSVDSFPIRRSSGGVSPRSERGRFPYGRGSVPIWLLLDQSISSFKK
ncbi:hypothetical protein MJO28_001075 [Puccinia striiformis f. sp. tritici]|uniref:Uncharacterized protein n=1 Tax=Puccinia striiformis f. sp. tritici TaxID=168172 RepID=A0ACC0EZM6_9BASI|nr:hypothetical protein MJO28_001075 [Puccinia striiformis f. sp. tritici]